MTIYTLRSLVPRGALLEAVLPGYGLIIHQDSVPPVEPGPIQGLASMNPQKARIRLNQKVRSR